MHTELITLSRACNAIEIPSGFPYTIPAGATVRIVQQLGGSYTVMVDAGGMFRIDPKDADALGFAASTEQAAPASQGELNEEIVRNELKTVYDPEIPVNIVDLGLIYSCVIQPHEKGGHLVDIKMSLTAPGCGMANVLKADVERKVSRLPNVTEVRVEVVFEPQWHPGLMSDAAKLQLGFDL
jgi:probable FeS assembly SUF system protein SufT